MEDHLESLEKVRQHFDAAPFPRIPLEQSPKGDLKYLYNHDLVVAYYQRHQRVIDPANTVILDAGCGTGYKALILAEANPGAKIVGIDLSDPSVQLARTRLHYHGFANAEFHTLTLEELPNLGQQFDYINCDEVLYLLPDPVQGLQAMRAVLKPNGILRVNMHHRLQRTLVHQAQEFFQRVQIAGHADPETEIAAVRTVMNALHDSVLLKARLWDASDNTNDEQVLANYLLVGDKSITIPELFAMLRRADLEFISMVNDWQWNLASLFQTLPTDLAETLAQQSIEDRLQLYALLNPIHRLLDVWCGHPGQSQPFTPVAEWTADQWQRAIVHLYPQLRVPAFREAMVEAIASSSFFEISRYLQKTPEPLYLDSVLTACLLPLIDAPRSLGAIAQHWRELRPLNPISLQPIPPEAALAQVQIPLLDLHQRGYILLEQP